MEEIAKRFAEKLLKKDIISEEDKPRYEYGVMIFLTTAIGIVSMLLLSSIFFGFWEGVLHLTMFAALRVCAGGYHCKTYFSCFCVSNVIFAVNMLFSEWLREMPVFWGQGIELCLVIICSVYIILHAPVLNPNNQLSAKRREKNRKNAIRTTVILSSIAILCVILFPRFEELAYVSSNATSVECSISALMLLEKVKQKGEKKYV